MKLVIVGGVAGGASAAARARRLVSHHLQILKHQGIVETERQGRFVVYRLHPKVFTDGYSLDLGCCNFKFARGAVHT